MIVFKRLFVLDPCDVGFDVLDIGEDVGKPKRRILEGTHRLSLDLCLHAWLERSLFDEVYLAAKEIRQV